MVLMPNTSFGQSKFSIGGIIIPQFTKITGELKVDDHGMGGNIFEMATTFQWAYGIEGIFQFDDYSSVNLAFLYSKQGQNYEPHIYNDPTLFNGSIEYSTSIDYFKIPLTYRFSIPSETKISFNFSLGIYISFLNEYNIQFINQGASGFGHLYATYIAEDKSFDVNATLDTLAVSESYKLSDKVYKSIDYGFVVGSGIDIKLNDRITIPITVNFDIGIQDIKNGSAYFRDPVLNDNVEWWKILHDDNSKETYTNITYGLRTGIRVRL
jgi:hypothetical protein